MDHNDGTHGGHAGHDMNNQCHVDMLFNWSYQNLCIIFPSWHINSLAKFLFSLLAIVVITAGYEAVREYSRRFESGFAEPLALRDRDDDRRRKGGDEEFARSKSVRALLYASQVFYSSFVMLLVMTYNAWVMLAVAVGAFLGFYMFGSSSGTKSVVCH